MTCEHPRKWEIKYFYLLENEEYLQQYLDAGWEPFAMWNVSGDKVGIRRLKPCEECKKV